MRITFLGTEHRLDKLAMSRTSWKPTAVYVPGSVRNFCSPVSEWHGNSKSSWNASWRGSGVESVIYLTFGYCFDAKVMYKLLLLMSNMVSLLGLYNSDIEIFGIMFFRQWQVFHTSEDWRDDYDSKVLVHFPNYIGSYLKEFSNPVVKNASPQKCRTGIGCGKLHHQFKQLHLKICHRKGYDFYT